ncbi:MAG: zinc-binding dehydrogenase, partial [Vicinamibacterales bacterium]
MKASYYELQGPRTLRLEEEELGECLQSGELLARTEFSAISTGTEIAAWQGKPPLRPSRAYPRLVGYSNVAEVIAIGDETDGLRVGDHILTHQSHRTAFRCGTGDVLLSIRGVSESSRKALATAYLYHLGYAALLRAAYTPGHAVAIVGFGLLGLATAQLVHAFGGSPIVFTARPDE